MTDAARTGRQTDPISVLHVDDDPLILDLTAARLGDVDDRFHVHTASGVRVAVSKLAEFQPDCVVSDYCMPAMDGLEFLEVVRRYHGPVPFVLYTGERREAVLDDRTAERVSGFVRKEGDSAEYEALADQITAAVERRRSRVRRGPGPVEEYPRASAPSPHPYGELAEDD